MLSMAWALISRQLDWLSDPPSISVWHNLSSPTFLVTFRRKVTLLHIFHIAGSSAQSLYPWSVRRQQLKIFRPLQNISFWTWGSIESLAAAAGDCDPSFLQAPVWRCWHSFNTVGWLFWWGRECCSNMRHPCGLLAVTALQRYSGLRCSPWIIRWCPLYSHV